MPEVPYGQLMMMADMDNRWVYKGSVTTPPCDTFVYWNVVQRVFPIKQAHLDQFMIQLGRGDLQDIGNYRETQKLDEHDPYIVTTSKTVKADINLNDELLVTNNEDGTISVAYNADDGSSASFNPKNDGTF